MLRLAATILLTSATLSCAMPAFAQDPAPAPGAPAAAAPAAPAVDPEAIAALEKMGRYLHGLKAFEVTSATMTDEVMEGGYKLQFDGKVSLKVRRPNQLRAEISSDRKQREMFYDGKTMTLYGPRVKYYATVPAPPTLHETIELMAKKYGVEMPLADLFYWGTDQSPAAGIKQAAYIGPAKVDDTETDQYMFRQEGVDWQIWIQQGQVVVPRKLVITSTSEPTQPAYVATMRWNVAPKLDDATFAFKPPAGAAPIPLQTADGKVEAAK